MLSKGDPVPMELWYEEHQRLMDRVEELTRNQAECKAKIDRWEQAGLIIRWVTIFTFSVLTMGVSAFEWLLKHTPKP